MMELDGRSGAWSYSPTPLPRWRDAACRVGMSAMPAAADVDGRCRRCHGDAAPETETRAARPEACVRGSRSHGSVGMGFHVGVASLRREKLEGRVSGKHGPGSTPIQLLAIWASFCYETGCKLLKLKYLILIYTKLYFIFWGPFKFRGHVRSHSPHGPKGAPSFCL